ncbi:MAG: FtsH protease activity modulator HflK, partial [Magnetococcales bacterium]|nr:FtsH protease activity modulator HflK [Magnetococcales bacterium]
MSWKNDDNGSNDPWNGRDGRPPDLEKLIQDLRNRFGQRDGSFFGHSSGNKTGQRKAAMTLLLVLLVLWMATGIYVVKPYEQGVVVRFGRWVETTGAGPHFHLPYPIETVYKPNVTQVQSIDIGYRTRDDRATVDVPAESLMLTGDENIIDIDLAVQYIVKDGAAYLFNVRDPATNPQQVVRNASESAIRMVVGRNNIDEALTSGKDKIQQLTKEMISQILNDYDSGILITAVQMQQVAPPKEVVHAFKDVASAREDRVRAVNEAQGYASDILPKAKGDAARIMQEAEAYKASRIARAEGDSKRFIALLEEYQKARDITRSRLYL